MGVLCTCVTVPGVLMLQQVVGVLCTCVTATGVLLSQQVVSMLCTCISVTGVLFVRCGCVVYMYFCDRCVVCKVWVCCVHVFL